MIKLGVLEPVALRSVWKDEARDFTPWLATEENIRALGQALGLELAIEKMEASVGPFYADLVCRDAADDSLVVIENQLETTNHSHMGQLLTYAAGLGAHKLIWVASKFREEHRAVLDWLNEHTVEGINCFGVEVELWSIDRSAPALKFNIVSKPNGWSKAVKSSTSAPADVSDHKKLQFEFWSAFKEWTSKNSSIKLPSPSANSWLPLSSGRSGFYYAVCTSLWNSFTKQRGAELRVELVVASTAAKKDFRSLLEHREVLERQIGAKLHWVDEERVKQCRVFVHSDNDIANKKDWPQQFKWLSENVVAMQMAFGPHIRGL